MDLLLDFDDKQHTSLPEEDTITRLLSCTWRLKKSARQGVEAGATRGRAAAAAVIITPVAAT